MKSKFQTFSRQPDLTFYIHKDISSNSTRLNIYNEKSIFSGALTDNIYAEPYNTDSFIGHRLTSSLVSGSITSDSIEQGNETFSFNEQSSGIKGGFTIGSSFKDDSHILIFPIIFGSGDFVFTTGYLVRLEIQVEGKPNIYLFSAYFNNIPDDKNILEINLLACNDVYNITDMSKWLNLANIFEQNNQKSNNIKVLAGDFISPNKNSPILKGLDMISASNISNFEVIGLGNHEFDFGLDILKMHSNISKGKFICSNISKLLCDEINVLYNYSMQVDKLKIGFIEYLTDTTPFLSVGATTITFDTLEVMFDNQKSFLLENDINILLVHADLSQIINYFNNNDNIYKSLIDAVILGHEHNNYTGYIERIGKPPIPYVEVALDSDGNFGLGIVNLKYDYNNKKLLSSNVNTIFGKELTNDLTPLNNLINNIVAPYFKETIGIIKNYPLDGLKSNIRNNETNMGDLIVDSFLNTGKSLLINKVPLENIFGIVNSGSIRNDSIIPIDTNFTTETIYTTLPFTNEIVYLKIGGKENLSYLLNYLGSVSLTRKNSGGWLQITSNLKFDYINNSFELLNYDKNIDEYYLILNDYLSEGNDGYIELRNYEKFSLDIPSQNSLRTYVKDILEGIVSITNIYTRIII